MLMAGLTIDANSIYFQYEELKKMATNVQSCLARTREGLTEAINRLELQVMYISKYMFTIPLKDCNSIFIIRRKRE